MTDKAMEAFGTLAGIIALLAIAKGLDPEPVLGKINEAIAEWIALTETGR